MLLHKLLTPVLALLLAAAGVEGAPGQLDYSGINNDNAEIRAMTQEYFAYTPKRNKLVKLNRECLFNQDDMDRLDPPLSYQRTKAEAPAGSLSDLRLSFDDRELAVITHGREYLMDGMVYFSLEELSPVSYDDGKVLARIKAKEGGTIRLISMAKSDEHTARLSYPSWLVIYEKGGNEDSRRCMDVYVHAERADYRLHSSVPLDFAADYQDQIAKRLSRIALIKKTKK